MIIAYRGIAPKIPPSVFVAPDATVIGDVQIGEDSSVWFKTVVRGDVNRIRIGKRTNIQDSCVVHVTIDAWPTRIGDGVTIGHGVIVHGCEIQDYCLVGMGARILDGARVGRYSIVAAGSVVREGMVVPERTLVAGVPAVAKRSLTDEEIGSIEASAQRYVGYKKSYTEMFTRPQ
jgi:carbonic anhydrase/acetyltransferase-like protein (isoleucine patch superfamily)